MSIVYLALGLAFGWIFVVLAVRLESYIPSCTSGLHFLNLLHLVMRPTLLDHFSLQENPQRQYVNDFAR
jgi:hypothetical protein